MTWKDIDNFFGKLASAILWIIVFVTLAFIGYYCDWKYKKANTKEALKEYNQNK